MRKSILSSLLILSLVLASLAPLNVSATENATPNEQMLQQEDETQNSTSMEEKLEKSGTPTTTEEDNTELTTGNEDSSTTATIPTEIWTSDDLWALADYISTYGSPDAAEGQKITIKVYDDIVVENQGDRIWHGIGVGDANGNHRFSGGLTFDGQGHIITLPDGGPGLFMDVDGATIRNVIIYSKGTLTEKHLCQCGNYGIGAVVAHCYDGTIENCGNLADIDIEVTESGKKTYAGGVVGRGDNCAILRCWNKGNITSVSYAGGIVGRCEKLLKVVSLHECYNYGIIDGDTAGGIAGELITAKISDCFNAGEINGRSYVGGIAGSTTTTYVKHSYNTGMVEATGEKAQAGGIVAHASALEFKDCYQSGNVSANGGNSAAGMIFATRTLDWTPSNCYYDTKFNVSGKSIGYNGKGLSTAEFSDNSKVVFGTLNTDEEPVPHWVFEKGYYPQLAALANSADAEVKAASKFSAVSSEIVKIYQDKSIMVLPSDGTWKYNGEPLVFGSAEQVNLSSATPVILNYTKAGFSKNIQLPSVTAEKDLVVDILSDTVGDMSKIKVDAYWYSALDDKDKTDKLKETDGAIEIPCGAKIACSVSVSDTSNVEWYIGHNINVNSEDSTPKKLSKLVPNIISALGLTGLTAEMNENVLTISGVCTAKPQEKPISLYFRGVDTADGEYWEIPIIFKPVKGMVDLEVQVDGKPYPEEGYTKTYDGNAPVFTWENAHVGNNKVTVQVTAAYYPESDKDDVSENAPVNVGKYGMDLTLSESDKESYELEEKISYSFEILQKDICEQLGNDAVVDIQNLINETVRVKIADVKEEYTKDIPVGNLVKDKDYTISYKKRADSKSWDVTIEGIGNYSGEFGGTFTISILVGNGAFALEKEQEYILDGNTSGQWYLFDQPLIRYQSGIRFYVKGDGNYNFVKVN